MRTLPLPAISIVDTVTRCLAGTTDSAFMARLQAIRQELEASATSYQTNAVAERLDLQPRVTSVGAVSKAELIGLYAAHLSARGGSGRAIYDAIKGAAPYKKCPLCGVGTVAVLDHHLPKAKYPDLSIAPANLVPTCHFCNDTKKARFPRNAGEQTLHPYFDARLIGTRWLRAVVNPGPPLVVTYGPVPPSAWALVDRERVARHFVVCGLATVFASNANDELATLKAWLTKVSTQGPSQVEAYLWEQAARYAKRTNGWQLSLYEALAADTWFVGGGFKAIA